jgi:hypothetical protein
LTLRFSASICLTHANNEHWIWIWTSPGKTIHTQKTIGLGKREIQRMLVWGTYNPWTSSNRPGSITGTGARAPKLGPSNTEAATRGSQPHPHESSLVLSSRSRVSVYMRSGDRHHPWAFSSYFHITVLLHCLYQLKNIKPLVSSILLLNKRNDIQFSYIYLRKGKKATEVVW